MGQRRSRVGRLLSFSFPERGSPLTNLAGPTLTARLPKNPGSRPRLAASIDRQPQGGRTTMSTPPGRSVLHHLRRVLPASGAGTSDRELLERFSAGRDEAAFADVVHRHG